MPLVRADSSVACKKTLGLAISSFIKSFDAPLIYAFFDLASLLEVEMSE